MQTIDPKERYKILVVEDEDAQRSLYKEYLTLEGFDVLDAQDGETALTMVRANTDLDFILLDLMMPKIDGVRVLEMLKADPSTKHITVYIMTVLGTDAMIKHAFEQGAEGYIIKDSMTPDQVRDEILKAISKKKK